MVKDVKWLPADRELFDPIKQVLTSNGTVEYYEKNAESFVIGTLDVDFKDVQKRFANIIPQGGYILDFECGSGRDAKAFIDMGSFFSRFAYNQFLLYGFIHEKAGIHKLFEACFRDNLHSIWAGQELYRKGNSQEEFYGILQKNMQPVYDSARRQGYEIWNKTLF